MGCSQEGSVFLSQKTRSSEQFLSLESIRKVQCFNSSKIIPSNTHKTIKKDKNILIQANFSTNSYILTLNANNCIKIRALMQMHDISCVPGSVTNLRAFVSSTILALHPCLFNLFFSHFFSSEPRIWKYAHYKTSSSLLPLALQMPHSCRSTSPLFLSPYPLKSN